jgi:hypothetical protein
MWNESMRDLPSEWAPLEARGRAIDVRPDVIDTAASGLSAEEQICRWALRLLLPMILALCGQLIFWMWFDDIYGPNVWSIVGGSLLAMVAVPVALWAWHSWLPDESELITVGAGSHMRNVFAALLAFVAVAGSGKLNDAGGPEDNVQTVHANEGPALPSDSALGISPTAAE